MRQCLQRTQCCMFWSVLYFPSLPAFLFDLQLNIRTCLLQHLKCLSFSLSCLRSNSFCIVHGKKKKKATLFLPKNNLSFKCPLQRGWSNLSWTLRRQKKVIARASHYLQQGRQRLADAAEAVRELFLLLALREERSGPGGLLWAIRILLWIMNTHRISLRAWMCPGAFVLLWFSPSSH